MDLSNLYYGQYIKGRSPSFDSIHYPGVYNTNHYTRDYENVPYHVQRGAYAPQIYKPYNQYYTAGPPEHAFQNYQHVFQETTNHKPYFKKDHMEQDKMHTERNKKYTRRKNFSIDNSDITSMFSDISDSNSEDDYSDRYSKKARNKYSNTRHSDRKDATGNNHKRKLHKRGYDTRYNSGHRGKAPGRRNRSDIEYSYESGGRDGSSDLSSDDSSSSGFSLERLKPAITNRKEGKPMTPKKIKDEQQKADRSIVTFSNVSSIRETGRINHKSGLRGKDGSSNQKNTKFGAVSPPNSKPKAGTKGTPKINIALDEYIDNDDNRYPKNEQKQYTPPLQPKTDNASRHKINIDPEKKPETQEGGPGSRNKGKKNVVINISRPARNPTTGVGQIDGHRESFTYPDKDAGMSILPESTDTCCCCCKCSIFAILPIILLLILLFIAAFWQRNLIIYYVTKYLLRK
ncbi:hypothetical protein AX774_g4879 [Zancudomyces culisetae]|uniref:Uncharacterized protein n=1 Tax=Zancudomyces culisetae TaxID=1213189 RepID=A0A1R1PL14_ZANCU|nr:hypothetical protein AX774_g4879 [Zancudomyces culisetae]|eukprot:OMH81660.1 hypothetical protein AX774_g4879 [Zancudomyces culisetae]